MVLEIYAKNCCMVNMSKRQQQDENVSPRAKLVFNERRGNTHTRGHAAAGAKTSTYTSTVKSKKVASTSSYLYLM